MAKMTRPEAQKICICGKCPSYKKCGEAWAFCLIESGKSKCITDENGCICPGCPVQLQSDFSNEYYCIRGSNQAISG
jgi:hypothetical protein